MCSVFALILLLCLHSLHNLSYLIVVLTFLCWHTETAQYLMLYDTTCKKNVKYESDVFSHQIYLVYNDIQDIIENQLMICWLSAMYVQYGTPCLKFQNLEGPETIEKCISLTEELVRELEQKKIYEQHIMWVYKMQEVKKKLK